MLRPVHTSAVCPVVDSELGSRPILLVSPGDLEVWEVAEAAYGGQRCSSMYVCSTIEPLLLAHPSQVWQLQKLPLADTIMMCCGSACP